MAQLVQSTFSSVAVQLDDRPVKKRIALVALSTDHTSERDFARICDPDQVGIYVNRIEFENPTTTESLLRTGPQLAAATYQILPDEAVDVIAFGCTAASIVLGNEVVEGYMNSAKPDTPCVTPSSAAFDAFKAFGARRVSVLTPYSVEVTSELVSYFSANGLDVINADCLGLIDDREMARVSRDTIVEAALAACDPSAEAMFISCTALRAADCVDEIEARLGKPVVTSNQAVIWRCLHHAGLSISDMARAERDGRGYGKLFELQPV